MRGREFLMKDLYDFSLDRQEHEKFYELMKDVYAKIFERLGIGEQTYLTMSSGGTFSKYSFEFQTITDAGEDTILYDKDKKIAINKEDYSEDMLSDFGLSKGELNLKEAKSVEVGDIYTLGDKFSKALGLTYKDESGEEKNVFMGSYGIGVPRVMGTIVEVYSDDKGIIWPEEVAPFKVHLIEIGGEKNAVRKASEELYNSLQESGIEVLYDDRDMKPGNKFADSDLIGIPYRVVVSEKTLKEGRFELKNRQSGETAMVSKEEILAL
jgi:prolyl-tRNA synthetase